MNEVGDTDRWLGLVVCTAVHQLAPLTVMHGHVAWRQLAPKKDPRGEDIFRVESLELRARHFII